MLLETKISTWGHLVNYFLSSFSCAFNIKNANGLEVSKSLGNMVKEIVSCHNESQLCISSLLVTTRMRLDAP